MSLGMLLAALLSWPAGGAESLGVLLLLQDLIATDAAPCRCQQPRGVPSMSFHRPIREFRRSE